MKVLLAAINAKYIHSNLGIYSLKTYGEKMLKEWGLAEQAEISLAEYTINHQMEQILQDIISVSRMSLDFPVISGTFPM